MNRSRRIILAAAWGAFLLLLMLFGAPPKLVGALTLPMVGLLVAIDPTSRRPGVGIAINLRSGPSSSASGVQRILLVSTKNATGGTATVETLYQSVANADAVGALAGVGGLAHLAAQRLFEEYPTATVDFAAMAAASGNTATGSIVFDDTTPVSVDQTVTVTIAGYSFTIPWAAAETDIAAATRLVAKITALSKFLPVTASNSGGASATVTITFKQKGKAGLDCKFSAVLSEGTGGSVTPTSATAMTGGTTEPDIANVLTLIANREYRFILPCLSNADVATASTTCNMGRLKTYIRATDTGIGALLQTAHSACTDSTTNAKVMSNQHDFEYFSHHLIRGALSLPCEWAAAIVGAYARETKSDPNHPMVKLGLVASLTGTPSIQSDGLTAAEQEDLLNSGVSYIDYDAQGLPRFARPISTYFEDADGNPDDRVLDVSKVFGMIAVGADLRTFCERTFQGKKLMPNLPSGNTPIPPNIVEVKDAQGLIVGRIRSQWVAAGVVRGDKLDEVIADGSLVVQVDPQDETQLDLFLPLRIVAPLVKTSLYLVQS